MKRKHGSKFMKMVIGITGVAMVAMFTGSLFAQVTDLYLDSFEAPTYTGAAAPDDPTVIGQNGWAQGGWGWGTKATVRETTATDGVNALRLGMDPAYGYESAIYKTFSTTTVNDGVVDLWVDMRHHGSSGQFFIGDTSMTLGEVYNPVTMTADLSTAGVGARFGFAGGNLIAESGDFRLNAGSAANGSWYQFHATIYPSISSYSLEILDSGGNVVVGADDWFSGLDPNDVGDYDLLSYKSSSTGGLQNIGLAGYINSEGTPLYMDNITITHDPNGTVPTVPTQPVSTTVYQDSFEAPTYTGGAAPDDPTLIGQNGWTAGNWGTDAGITVRTVPMLDGTAQGVRLGTGTTLAEGPTGSASAYKEVSTTSLADGGIDFWVDYKPHGTKGYVLLGDSNMTLDETVEGDLATNGVAAMIGVQNGFNLNLYSGDQMISSGVQLGNGSWCKIHTVVYPEIGAYAVEVLNSSGATVVGFDDWVSSLSNNDVGEYDLFSFRDANVSGVQNVGLVGTTYDTVGPLYVDNMNLYHTAEAFVPEGIPEATTMELKHQISFETSEGYTSSEPYPGTDIIGQNGWTVGAWGTGTLATARITPATDGEAALRVGSDDTSTKVAVYKELSSTPITDDTVEVWVDLASYGSYSYFALGDSNMVMGDDGSGNPLNDGIAAMFGFGNGAARVIDGDTTITADTLTLGAWYEFHAVIDLASDVFSLEVFDTNGNLVVGFDDWLADSADGDMGEYDVFSFRDTNVDSLQNIGVRCATTSSQPLYVDNFRLLVPESDEKIAGDANGDGKVDGSDVTILAGNWQKGVSDGLTASWAEGDFNGDGKVDGSDVTILAGNWQYGVNAAAAAVPEPSTLVLLLGVLFTLGVLRRR